MSVFSRLSVLALESRSQHCSPGVRKQVKAALSRARRRAARKEDADAAADTFLNDALSDDLLGFTDDEMSFFQSAGLLDANRDHEDAQHDADLQILCQDLSEAAVGQLPAYLVGSLPDWMLNELEQANGSALEEQLLFEVQSRTTQAARLTADDAMYA